MPLIDDPPPDRGRLAHHALLARDDAPPVGGVFRHYKSNDLYVVMAISIDEATLEPLVTYRGNETGWFWTRPLAAFIEDLWLDGVPGPIRRFSPEY